MSGGFVMRRHVILGALVLGLTLAGPVSVRAQQAPAIPGGSLGELARLNQLILRAPTDVSLNLQYAAVAESLGVPRLALAAYERVLMADPNNQAAQAGVDRVRIALQPSTTQYVLDAGYLWERNPRYLAIPSIHGRNQFVGALNVIDERNIDDLRWRTTGDVSVRDYTGTGVSDLDYGHVGAVTGPVYQLNPGLTFNPGLGAGAAYFDHHWFYAEVSGNAAFSVYPGGAEQSLLLRGAYRDYNHAFYPHTAGGYADATGKLTLPNYFPDTVIGLSPWVRVSEIAGGLGKAVVPFMTDIQPGDYVELGSRAQVYHSLTDYLILGGNFSVGGRFYQSVEVAGSHERRKDATLSPGVQLVVPNFIVYQTDLKFAYQYTWNHSNIAIDSYRDHVVSVSIQARF